MSISTEIVKVTTTGVAGEASGNTDSGAIKGELLDVYIDYHASAPATTDVTITHKRGGNILVVSNNATDGRYHPRAKPVDNANAAITDAHAPFVIDEAVNVAVAQCDALTDAVTVYLTYRK